MHGGQPQVVNVSLSQMNRESLSRADILCGLLRLKDAVVKLDDVAKMESGRWRAEHEKNVGVASSIAVRQRHVEPLNGRAHGMTPNKVHTELLDLSEL